MESKIEITTLSSDCPDETTCSAIRAIGAAPDLLFVQGQLVSDPAILAACEVPAGEGLVAVPRSLLPEV